MSFALLLLSRITAKTARNLFGLDDRGLRKQTSPILSKVPIPPVHDAVTDRQPAVGIVHHGDPLADRRLGWLAGSTMNSTLSYCRSTP